MVKLVGHIFKYNASQLLLRANLLNKYYPKTEIQVLFDNNKVLNTRIEPNFVNQIIKIPSTQYMIITDKVDAEAASIRTIAEYPFINRCPVSNNKKVLETAKIIDNVLATRVGYNCHHEWQRDFQEISDAAKFLVTPGITRMYISTINKTIFVIMLDRHTIKITETCISESTLPSFDIDDGYAYDRPCFICDEFNKSFQKWKKLFDINGANWNAPILNNDLENWEKRHADIGKSIYDLENILK